MIHKIHTTLLTSALAAGLLMGTSAFAADNEGNTRTDSAQKRSTQTSSGQDKQKLKFVEANTQYGYDVTGSEGQRLGDIADYVFDLQNQKITHVLVNTGGFLGIGGETRAVPADAVSWKNAQYTMDISKSEFQDVKPLDRNAAAFFQSDENLDKLARTFDVKNENTAENLTLASALDNREVRLQDDARLGEIEVFAINLPTNRVGYAQVVPEGMPATVAEEGRTGRPARYMLPLGRLSEVSDDELQFDLSMSEVTDSESVAGLERIDHHMGELGQVYTIATN